MKSASWTAACQFQSQPVTNVWDPNTCCGSPHAAKDEEDEEKEDEEEEVYLSGE